jgi:glutamine---fructose-6-phosphate transaminase (isomerizing)
MTSSYVTYSEIKRQPDTWKQTLQSVMEQKDMIKQLFNEVNPEEVIFVGCGTSYYISIAAALSFQEVTGISAKAVPASEVFLKPDSVINKNKRNIVIGTSRSGTTSEVVRAIEYVQNNNLGQCLGITGYPDSDLAQVAQKVINLPHIQEKSVVMTSSFTNLLLSLQLTTAIVADNQQLLDELHSLPDAGSNIMEKSEDLAREIGGNLAYDHFVYLGLGANFGLANEGMLKLKEMTQVHSEVYNPLEFRHGPISIIKENCLTVILTNQSILDFEQAVIKDVQKYNGAVLAVGELPDGFVADYQLNVGTGFSDVSREILYLPLLQLLAYYRTLKLQLNPDQPRNLSQVVKLK